MNIIPRSKDFTLYSNKENSQVRMYITQGEYATTLANFTLYDGSTALDLTNASQVLFSVYFTHNRNTATTLPVEITDADDGKISVATVANLSANYDGNGMDCFVQAIFPTKTVKFSGMKIYVKADPSLDVLAQTDDAHTLIDAINKLALINGGTGTIEVDDALSTTSTKPVQNKKITEKINEMDSYLSGHSFIYDLWGRIYSYSNSSTITPSSFGDAITRTNGCYVWLGKNVTSVADNSLPDPQYISQIRYEGKAEDLTIGEMYASKVTYGRSNRSVFYFLATLSYLFNNMVTTSNVYSKTDSDNRYRLQTAKITENDLASVLLTLINGKADSTDVYTQTQADNTFEKTTNKKQSISVDRQTTTAENVWYPSITAIKSFLFTNFYTQDEVDSLLDEILDETDNESIVSILDNKLNNENNVIKSRHITDGAVTEAKLAAILANKINAKIDISGGVKYVTDKASIDDCVLSDTIYYVRTTSMSGVTGNHIVICVSAANQRTQYLFAQEGGIQYRKQVKSGGVYGDWGSWTQLATTATTTQLSDAITALNTAVESLQQNAIMKAQGAVIENYINDGAVTEAKLAPALKSELDNKIDTDKGVLFVSAQNANNCLSQNTLYVLQTEVEGHLQNTHTMIVAEDIDNRAQYRFSVEGGFEYRVQTGLLQEGNSWSEWKSFATASDVTEIDGELSDLLQNLSNNYYTITQIDGLLSPINNLITENNLTNKKWNFVDVGQVFRSNIFDDYTDPDTIYVVRIAAVNSLFFTINNTQVRYVDTVGWQKRVKTNDIWGEWEGSIYTGSIQDGAITQDKLASSVYESIPTSASSKLITSGGVYNYVAHSLSISLEVSNWNNKMQVFDLSQYDITENTKIELDISDTVYSQLDSCGCESISAETIEDNNSMKVVIAIEGKIPTSDITIGLILSEAINLDS